MKEVRTHQVWRHRRLGREVEVVTVHGRIDGQVEMTEVFLSGYRRAFQIRSAFVEDYELVDDPWEAA